MKRNQDVFIAKKWVIFDNKSKSSDSMQSECLVGKDLY